MYKAITYKCQEMIYLTLRKKACELGRKINNLMTSMFPNADIYDKEDFIGRRPIGLFMTDEDVVKSVNRLSILETILRTEGIDKEQIRKELDNIPDREILNHARLIHRQAIRGVIEEDLKKGLRPWQLSWRKKIYQEIENEQKKIKELTKIAKTYKEAVL